MLFRHASFATISHNWGLPNPTGWASAEKNFLGVGAIAPLLPPLPLFCGRPRGWQRAGTPTSLGYTCYPPTLQLQQTRFSDFFFARKQKCSEKYCTQTRFLEKICTQTRFFPLKYCTQTRLSEKIFARKQVFVKYCTQTKKCSIFLHANKIFMKNFCTQAIFFIKDIAHKQHFLKKKLHSERLNTIENGKLIKYMLLMTSSRQKKNKLHPV